MKTPIQGIATDAAHSAKERLTRFRAVDLSTGEELFSETIGNQTANIGEFLGIITATQYILDNHFQPPIIYSDSTTAISWFRNKMTASSRRYPPLFRAEIFLKALAFQIETIEVRYWDNQKWGEIPADYGNK